MVHLRPHVGLAVVRLLLLKMVEIAKFIDREKMFVQELMALKKNAAHNTRRPSPFWIVVLDCRLQKNYLLLQNSKRQRL